MIEFFAAIIVFALAVAGMSIGLLVSGRRLKGSCGGMNNLKKLLGATPCDACRDPSPDCPQRKKDATD